MSDLSLNCIVWREFFAQSLSYAMYLNIALYFVFNLQVPVITSYSLAANAPSVLDLFTLISYIDTLV